MLALRARGASRSGCPRCSGSGLQQARNRAFGHEKAALEQKVLPCRSDDLLASSFVAMQAQAPTKGTLVVVALPPTIDQVDVHFEAGRHQELGLVS